MSTKKYSVRMNELGYIARGALARRAGVSSRDILDIVLLGAMSLSNEDLRRLVSAGATLQLTPRLVQIAAEDDTHISEERIAEEIASFFRS